MQDKQIMIIDTNQAWRETIGTYLERHRIKVLFEERGDAAFKRIMAQPPDLIITEYFLPGLDGKALCRDLRPQFPHPIIMLTDHDDEIDEIVMLEMGVDLYLHKPISNRLLLAHITNLIQRYETCALLQTRPTPTLELDIHQRRARLNETVINLTTCEFELLNYFFEHQGIMLSRKEIYRQLCHTQWDGKDRSIDLRISRLRTKIEENPKSPCYIKSIRGVGYVFVNII